jgi:hypothetical protein
MCLVAACVLFGIVAPACASVAIVPSRIEVTAQRGERATFEVSVATSGTPYPVQVTATAWNFARAENGEPKLITGAAEEKVFRGCASWVETPGVSVVVPPGGARTLRLVVDVPEDADYGTHFCYVAVVAIPTKGTITTKAGQVQVVAPLGYRMNALLLVAVEGKGGKAPLVSEGATLEAFDVKRINFSESVPILTRITNTGNVHLIMKQGSKIEIFRGRVKADEIPVQAYTLLPANSIAVPTVWKASSPVGVYTARFFADVGLPKPITGTRTFYVLDWHALAVAGVALVVLAGLIAVFLRRFRVQLAPRGSAGPTGRHRQN